MVFRRARPGHSALTFEERAFIDDHHRGVDVAIDPRVIHELYSVGSVDVAYHLAGNLHDAGADGCIHDALLADYEAVIRDDLASQPAVQHHCAAERELSFYFRTFGNAGREIRHLRGRPAALLPEHGLDL